MPMMVGMMVRNVVMLRTAEGHGSGSDNIDNWSYT
jgi:hypothetical protein